MAQFIPTNTIEKIAPEVIRVPSAFLAQDGRARFHMNVPATFMKDAGIAYLVRHEIEMGGYEYATRAFLDAHLNANINFIDVGAHWGIFTLHAATAPNGVGSICAIEAHPGNVKHLHQQLKINGLESTVNVVAEAVGKMSGTADLVINSTMGNSVGGVGLPKRAPRDRVVQVPMRTIDAILKEQLNMTQGRFIVKIDVEGLEPEAITGMQELLDAVSVDAIIWEKGGAFCDDERRTVANAMMDSLDARSFTHHRFAHSELGGPLLPFAWVPESLNVFSIAPNIKLKSIYGEGKPPLGGGRIPSISPSCKAAPYGPACAAVARHMLANKATDASRWSDPQYISDGAEARAAQIAKVVPFDVHGLDLGCGMQRLRGHFRRRGKYVPADIVQWTPDTLTCDLNAKFLPRGVWDVAVMSHVLEYIHDPEWVLERLAFQVHRLVLLLATPVEDPSSLGRFHVFELENMAKLLKSTGWIQTKTFEVDQGQIVVAERLSLI